ncbi:MAG: hypothetical protein ACKKL5_01455 [Candidatus Komeilibacteria bacterium]
MIQKYTIAFKNTLNNIKTTLPILIGVILFIAWIITIIPPTFYNKIFIGNSIIDSLVGALVGSMSAGNPINSYIIGEQLLKQNVSLVAVTAFILSWVTVGVVQFPAEALLLGKKFALTRNIISFFFAIIISMLTVLILKLI